MYKLYDPKNVLININYQDAGFSTCPFSAYRTDYLTR